MRYQQQFLMEVDQRLPFVNYTFNKQYRLHYGQALFLVGSLPELGKWDTSKAIRMTCKHQDYWISTVSIPIQMDVQYRYFVGDFEPQSESCKRSMHWVGDGNQTIRIYHHFREKFEKNNSNELQVMSFNLRYENSLDKGEISWEARKNKCSGLILQHLPDIVGTQEGKNTQIAFLRSKIGNFYRYYGKPRDLHEDENCGIFVRRDKFFVRKDGYLWINETQTPGKKGFGARLPRYITYLILQPVSSEHLIMVVNTHLDHQVGLARQEGVKLIAATINEALKQFAPLLKDVFLTGDFNTADNDPIFEGLTVANHKMESVRYILGKAHSDLEETFNGFRPRLMSVVGMFTSRIVIDHIFVLRGLYVAERFRVLRDELVSDHYPIVGYFRLKK